MLVKLWFISPCIRVKIKNVWNNRLGSTCLTPIPSFKEFSKIPLEHTPEGIPFIWGFRDSSGYAPGVCWGFSWNLPKKTWTPHTRKAGKFDDGIYQKTPWNSSKTPLKIGHPKRKGCLASTTLQVQTLSWRECKHLSFNTSNAQTAKKNAPPITIITSTTSTPNRRERLESATTGSFLKFHVLYLQACGTKIFLYKQLVGGFNPSEKYARQIENLPQIDKFPIRIKIQCVGGILK